MLVAFSDWISVQGFPTVSAVKYVVLGHFKLVALAEAVIINKTMYVFTATYCNYGRFGLSQRINFVC